MSELVTLNKKYKCKRCGKTISGKYILLHLLRCHNIDVGSWKKHKLALYVEEEWKEGLN